jgi:hypothetical protein
LEEDEGTVQTRGKEGLWHLAEVELEEAAAHIAVHLGEIDGLFVVIRFFQLRDGVGFPGEAKDAFVSLTSGDSQDGVCDHSGQLVCVALLIEDGRRRQWNPKHFSTLLFIFRPKEFLLHFCVLLVFFNECSRLTRERGRMIAKKKKFKEEKK